MVIKHVIELLMKLFLFAFYTWVPAQASLITCAWAALPQKARQPGVSFPGAFSQLLQQKYGF